MAGLYQAIGSGRPGLDKVEQAAREFEALLLTNLLRIMRESIDQSELFGSGLGGQFYMELIDQQIARALAEKGGIGIADLLMRQLESRERVGEGELTVEVSPLSEGEPVAAGQAIAQAGSSGRATRAHLHFEPTQNGKTVALYPKP